MNISDEILRSLEKTSGATAAQLASMTGISIKKVSAAMHHLISAGKAEQIGEALAEKSRYVNLYAAKVREDAKPIAQQTWFSPMMQ